jgi:diguanylate cyclase (GGDEF)-like protein
VGGVEFLAILPETSREGAAAVAEKLLESLALPYAIDRTEAQLSASAGISAYPEHGLDAEGLQRAADGALYEAKRAGKNRVRVAALAEAAPQVALAKAG